MWTKKQIDVDKFDIFDFGVWKMWIEDHLHGKDLYQPIKSKFEMMEQVDWEMLDRKAMSVIRFGYPRMWRITQLHQHRQKR